MVITNRCYLLLAAVIVALFGLASADSCRYYQGNISCCKRVLDRKRQGGLIFYRCRQCEDGHVLSDDKTQCVPDTSCASGTGPGLKNVAKKGECYSCSDDNCVDCSGVYYWCNVCDDNYHADGGTCNQNLLY